MRVKIDVTKRHINKGKQSEGDACPVALAVNKHLKRQFCAYVGCSNIEISHRTKWDLFKNIDTPESVAAFVNVFDEDSGASLVKPFSFSLNIPKEFVRSTALKK